MSKVSELARMMAKKGRNGDSILVHMQPREVKNLEIASGKKATTNPATGLKEGFAFIPFLGLLAKAVAAAAAASGASAIVNKVANRNNDKNAAADLTRSQQDLKDRNERIAQQYRIPLLQMQQAQGPPPGYLAGVSPEQNIAPIQKPIGWASPSGQFGSYAEGGMIPEQQEAESVIDTLQQQMETGDVDPALLNRAIEIYGQDQLAEMLGVQNQPSEEMPSEGMAGGGLLRGPGKGMDDLIHGTIRGQQKVALAGGEYIVPADVTSMVGDGSSDAGGRAFDAMVARVRMMKTGTPAQAGKINHRAVMPA